MDRNIIIQAIRTGASHYDSIDILKEYLIDLSELDPEVKSKIGDMDIFIAKILETPTGFHRLFQEAMKSMSRKYNILYLRDSDNNIINIY